MRFVLRAVHPGARPILSRCVFLRTGLYLFANAGFKALGARTWLLETVGAGAGVTGKDGGPSPGRGHGAGCAGPLEGPCQPPAPGGSRRKLQFAENLCDVV